MVLNDNDVLRLETEAIAKDSNIITVFLISHVLEKVKTKLILFEVKMAQVQIY